MEEAPRIRGAPGVPPIHLPARTGLRLLSDPGQGRPGGGGLVKLSKQQDGVRGTDDVSRWPSGLRRLEVTALRAADVLGRVPSLLPAAPAPARWGRACAVRRAGGGGGGAPGAVPRRRPRRLPLGAGRGAASQPAAPGGRASSFLRFSTARPGPPGSALPASQRAGGRPTGSLPSAPALRAGAARRGEAAGAGSLGARRPGGRSSRGVGRRGTPGRGRERESPPRNFPEARPARGRCEGGRAPGEGMFGGASAAPPPQRPLCAAAAAAAAP